MEVTFILFFLMHFTFELVKCGSLQSFSVHVEHYEFMPVNSSGALNTYKTRSMLHCATGCLTNEGTAFCYSKLDRLCNCYLEEVKLVSASSNDTTTPANTFYLYGYKLIDCLSLYEAGLIEDGAYWIYPNQGPAMNVWCDMTNGGWTVIQRRLNGSVDFFRPWNDYVHGFGDVTGELWLGLESIHSITQSPSSLDIRMETFGDVVPPVAYANYTSFLVEGSATNYTMHVDGFSGNCGDSFLYHDGRQFFTKDRDTGKNCAKKYSGAWWYRTCHYSNLNGLYLAGYHDTYANGINWHACWGYYYSMKSVVMQVKRILT